ncbi:hypothetical protein HZB60_02460 [candidate division KSB1 bacterium]|nr:hypothetical protein [candidate division KSB1 bacterium]
MSGPAPPEYLSPEQVELFDRLAAGVAARRLTVPALLFLESARPLNFVGSQAMLFFAPFVHALFDTRQYDLVREALERRETIGWLCDLLDAKEEVVRAREKALKSERRVAKTASRKRRRGWFK